MTRLRADRAVPETATFDLWSSAFYLREEWFVDNHVYWAKDIDFEIRLHQHQEEWRRVLVGGHNVEVFAEPPASHAKVFVLAPARRSHFAPIFLLYVATPQCFHIAPGCK